MMSSEPDAAPLPIDASTKIAALLDHYPQLEDVLIAMAPPFRKLKNPLLRKSVAKIASIRQAAAVARIPAAELVNRLRAEVGQTPAPSVAAGPGEDEGYFADPPPWFDAANVIATIDEATGGDPDEMTLKRVMHEAVRLEPGQAVELMSSFLPAPGIDVMKAKGYAVWAEEGPDRIRTRIARPPG